MGYQNFKPNAAIGIGGAGNPGAWDLITGDSYDLGGKIVAAFMSMDAAGGTFTEMEEETVLRRAGKAGASTAVAANILAYTFPQYIVFEGRYTKLIPARGTTFKVWFLK